MLVRLVPVELQVVVRQLTRLAPVGLYTQAVLEEQEGQALPAPLGATVRLMVAVRRAEVALVGQATMVWAEQ